MPLPVEIALYQLGLRLTQAEYLYHLFISPSFEPPSFFGSLRTCDYEVTIRYAVAAVDDAFDFLEKTAEVSQVISAGCKALIRDCNQRWTKSLEISRAASREDRSGMYLSFSENVAESCVNIRHLRDTVARRIVAGIAAKDLAQAWFDLGLKICSGEPQYCSNSHKASTNSGVGHKSPNAISSFFEVTGWAWIHPENLKGLLEATGTNFGQLCPPISDSQVNLLPYDPSMYERWFQAEVGLNSLLGMLPKSTAEDTPGESLSLRLKVDVKRKIATFDGEPHSLPDETAAYYVAALVAARGDWITQKEIFTEKSGFQGGRPDRIKPKLPEAIRSLIETQDGKGSRIPISKLLPQNSLPNEWRDHAQE